MNVPLDLRSSNQFPCSHEDNSPSLPGLRELAAILKNSRLRLLLGIIAGALLALTISLIQKPRFEAHASLEVQRPNADFLNARTLDPRGQANGGGVDRYLDTQAEILQSRSLIREVIHKTIGRNPKTSSGVPVSAAVRMLWLDFSSWLGTRNTILRHAPSSEDEVDQALRNLTVSSSASSEILKISYLDTDPKIAAAFVNNLAHLYLELNRESHWNASKETGTWLNRHTEDFRNELARMEEELESYSHSSGLMLTSGKENIQEAKLRDLQTELTKVQAERVQKQSEYEASLLHEGSSLNGVVKDPGLAELQSHQAELRRQIADLLTIYMPESTKVQRLQAQLAELTKAVESRKHNLISQIKSDYDAIARREQILSSTYAHQSALVSDEAKRLAHFNMISHEVESRRQIYDSMLRQVQDAAVVSAIDANIARVIDEAVVPTFPAKPRLELNVLAGGFSGLLLTVLVIFVRERLNNNLRSPGELIEVTQALELGVIPSLGVLRRSKLRDMSLKGWLLASPVSHLLQDEGAERTRSAFSGDIESASLAESFRAVSASLQFMRVEKNGPQRVLTITSPGPMEGKTTVLTNIGIAQAESGNRVLLMDCDVRRPRLHSVFGLRNNWGVTGLLTSDADIAKYPLEGIVCSTDVPNLFVVPSGPPVTNLTQLWNSPRTKLLLQRLAKEYPLILLDTPPVLPFADARMLAQISDGVILIARSNHTSRHAAQAAAERLTSDGARILGTVLNDFVPLTNNQQESYYSYYAGKN